MARRVNRLGAERGLRLTYGRAAVSQWISGHLPPPAVRQLVAEILSERTGTRHTAATLWPDSLTQQALLFTDRPADSIALLADLARGDMDRRHAVLSAAYVAGASVTPAWRWLVGSDDLAAAGSPATGRQSAEAADAERLHRLLSDVDALDHLSGGGQSRPQVVRILHGEALPLLRGPIAPGARRDLFTATALLTRKAALAAYDSGAHGLAQRYFVQALRLAHAAGHRALGAHILVSMSHQALDIDQPALAAELASAAAAGTGSTTAPTLACKIALLRARAHARLRDRSACTRQITGALAHFEAADPAVEPWWTGSISPAYVDGQIAHCHLDLGAVDAAEQHARAALDAHSPRHRRRQAMGGLLLARIHAAHADTTLACRAGTTAVAFLPELASHRTLVELRQLTDALRPSRHRSDVKEFLGHARLLLRAG